MLTDFRCSSERCVFRSKVRMESTSVSNNSIRYGLSLSGVNTSRIPPRTLYSPLPSTMETRSYPCNVSFSRILSRSISSPLVISITFSAKISFGGSFLIAPVTGAITIQSSPRLTARSTLIRFSRSSLLRASNCIRDSSSGGRI